MEKKTREQLQGKKILFATVPAEGHINPLTDLALFLKTSGCDVRWYTSNLYKNKIEELGIPHFSFVHAPDTNGDNVNDVFPERTLITDAGAKANFDITHIFANAAPGLFKDVQEIANGFDYDLVITDSLFPAIPFFSKLNTPVIAIGVFPLAEESEDLGPYGPGFYPPANDVERKKYAELREIFKQVVFKESIDTFSAILEDNNIAHEKALMFDTLIKHADLYLQIGTPSFEYKRSKLGSNIRFIGSLLPYFNYNQMQPWFDERLKQYKKVVLVTQGTIESDVTKLLKPTLEAFKGTDILVIATTAGNQTNELRKEFPYDNMIIEDYLPFSEVMRYATVYITNGGYSGTMLSIKNRLPIIAGGLHEGKAEICSRIGHFKYGIDLKTETPAPEAIRKAFESIIADNTYKENIIRLSQEMETYNAKELCASYICDLLDKTEELQYSFSSERSK